MIKSMKRPQNLAGIMGQSAMQPAQMAGNMTVDPLERAQQKMAGRTQGGAVNGVNEKKPRSRRTLMTNYGMM
jgi:hypothetical protein